MILALCEMQTASFRFWTWVKESTSYENNIYTVRAPVNLYLKRKVNLHYYDKDRNWLTLSNSARERPSSWERLRKDFFGGTSDGISHHIHIVGTSCSQLPARSGIFCPLVEVVYWPSRLKFVYPTINLAFLGIIVNVKLHVKFCLQFWIILSPNQ